MNLTSAPLSVSAAPGTLVVCLDLQPALLGVLHEGGRVKQRCQFTVAVATQLGVTVLFTEQAPEKLGGTDPEILSLGASARVFAKTSFSALGDETIRAALLGEHASEHLLLCGLETSVCVYQTAVDALSAGLQVTVLADAAGARRPEDHCTCLESLRSAGVHVLPAETVFYAILRDAGHSFFRDYTKLVKKYG